MTLGATSRHDLLTGGAPPTHHGAPPGPMMLQFIKYLLSISVGSHVWNYIVINFSSVTCMCHMHVLCIRLQLLSTLLLLSYSMHFSYLSILSCPTPTSVHFLLYTLPLLCNHPLKLWFEKTKPAPSTHIFIVPSSQKHVKLTPQPPPYKS